MSIRRAENCDLPAIAAIHKSQFSSHFLGQYSPRMLEGYYRQFLNASVFLVHETAGRVDGFVLGATNGEQAASRAAFLHAHWGRGLRETLVRPSLWRETARRILLNLRSFRSGTSGSTQSSVSPSISIVSIAVSPEAMGTGLAAALIEACEQSLRERRLAEYGLSVAKDNPRAIHFYQKMGFEITLDDGQTLSLCKRLCCPADDRPAQDLEKCRRKPTN
jgi:ribosomal protein S18 acetylase RimI-like enzyme